MALRLRYLMSTLVALHVHCSFLYISMSFSAKQQRDEIQSFMEIKHYESTMVRHFPISF